MQRCQEFVFVLSKPSTVSPASRVATKLFAHGICRPTVPVGCRIQSSGHAALIFLLSECVIHLICFILVGGSASDNLPSSINCFHCFHCFHCPVRWTRRALWRLPITGPGLGCSTCAVKSFFFSLLFHYSKSEPTVFTAALCLI